MFLLIAFIFANGLSLMTNVAAWSNLWRWHSVGGAATGTALNLADATLWPRWLLMFGLALGTTAVWAVIDATWGGKGDRHLLPARPDGCFAQKVPVTFSAEENEEYKRWARQFAFRVALGGAVWATIAGTWYVFGTWSGEVRDEMFAFPTILLTLLTAASPWFAVVVLWLWRRRQIGRLEAAAIGAVQFAALALNAISRQIVQNLELGSRLFRPVDRPGQFDWGPLMLFLLSFVAGAAVVAWILRQLRKASPAADAAGPSS